FWESLHFPPPEDATQEMAAKILLALTFITSLKFINWTGTISIIDYLASPQPYPGKDSENKPRSWPCPRLEKVIIMCDEGDCHDVRDALDRLRSNRAACLIEGQMDDPRGLQLEDHRPCSINELTIKNSNGVSLQTWSEEGWIFLEVDRTLYPDEDSSPIEEPE
ncbi:hypothetical protein FRC01_010605, partial [Tulasnella sp. 417]